MTAATSGETAAGSRTERISTMTQVRGALHRVSASWRLLLTLFLLSVSVAVGFDRIDRAVADLNKASQGFTLLQVATILLRVLASSLLAAVELRVLLWPGERAWRRFDRPLLDGVVFYLVVNAVFVAASYGFMRAVNAANLGDKPWVMLAVAAGYAAIFGVVFRLALWPAARLKGREDVTLAQSWRLMRRATRGFVLAHVAVGAIPFVAFTAIWMMSVVSLDTGVRPSAAVFQQGLVIIWIGLGVWSRALTATVYRLRVESPATVAKVFD